MLFVGHMKNAAQQGNTATQPATPDPSRSGTPMKDEPYGLGEGERRPIWQEVLHKARVRLCRTPLGWHFDHNHGYVPPTANPLVPGHDSPFSQNHILGGRPDEFSYHLEIVEDLDDDRVHEDDAKTRPYNDILHAGIRESIPIRQISKIFYTDSGRILNIGNADEAGNNPVLLLKRDTNAPTPAELSEELMSPESFTTKNAIEDPRSGTSDEQNEIDRQLRDESGLPDNKQHPLSLHFPSHLDPEWLALEVFVVDDDYGSSDTEDEYESERPMPTIKAKRPTVSNHSSLDANLVTQIKTLSLHSSTDLTNPSGTPESQRKLEKLEARRDDNFISRSPFNSITSSLSLMEMLIRLTSLQEFQQAAHLSIPDYILSFFLEETSTTGLRGEARWKARNEAKRRVGFDPYTDTPSK